MNNLLYIRKIVNLEAPTATQLKDAVRFAVNHAPVAGIDEFKSVPERKDVTLLKFNASEPDELGYVRFRILAEIKDFGVRKIQMDVNNETYMPRKSLVCNVSISSAAWGEYCMKDDYCFYSIV